MKIKLVLCPIVAAGSITIDCLKCWISKSSIVFDWQNLGVSFMKLAYQTQSKSFERLEFDWIRLPNVRLAATDERVGNQAPRMKELNFICERKK